MLKTMVFIDYQNVNINLKKHCELNNKELTNISYKKLAEVVNSMIPMQSQVVKTYVFAPKPCNELMQLESYYKYYAWLQNLKKVSYVEVIEGRHEIIPTPGCELNIFDHTTYSVVEKETDVNMATHMLEKGFHNAYDIAILASGDTDYSNVIKVLHNLGKIVVVVRFPHQRTTHYNNLYDSEIILFENVLSKMYYK